MRVFTAVEGALRVTERSAVGSGGDAFGDEPEATRNSSIGCTPVITDLLLRKLAEVDQQIGPFAGSKNQPLHRDGSGEETLIGPDLVESLLIERESV